MPNRKSLGSTDFLADEPAKVSRRDAAQANAPPDPRLTLPPDVVTRLMRIEGVDGVWVEQDRSGGLSVVLHARDRLQAFTAPRTVNGMPVRVVHGGPINALAE